MTRGVLYSVLVAVLAFLPPRPAYAGCSCGCNACVMAAVATAKSATATAWVQLQAAFLTLEGVLTGGFESTQTAITYQSQNLQLAVSGMAFQVQSEIRRGTKAEGRLFEALNKSQTARKQQLFATRSKVRADEDYQATEGEKYSFAAGAVLSPSDRFVHIAELRSDNMSWFNDPENHLMNAYGDLDFMAGYTPPETFTEDDLETYRKYVMTTVMGVNNMPADAAHDVVQASYVPYAEQLKPVFEVYAREAAWNTSNDPDTGSFMQYLSKQILNPMSTDGGNDLVNGQAGLSRLLRLEVAKSSLLSVLHQRVDSNMSRLRALNAANVLSAERNGVREMAQLPKINPVAEVPQ